jgi:hypothetical protein
MSKIKPFRRKLIGSPSRCDQIHRWPVVWLVSALVGGALTLAIIDESCRTAFIDLAQVGLGGYIALLVPRRGK